MIMQWLSEGEGKTLEFKETIQTSLNFIKTVIAFANTAGGTIVVGVRDKTKDIIGVKDVLREEERLANIIADSIEPLLIPDIEIITFRERELLVVKVPHMVGPYYIKSAGLTEGVYIRLGSTNRLADRETLDALKRLSKNISFDELPCVGATQSELNRSIIAKKFNLRGRKNEKQIYVYLGLLSSHLNKDYPSNAGMLVFGKQRFKWFPDSIIHCVAFKGVDKSHIIDQKDIETELLLAPEEIIVFIERHVNVTVKIGRLEREEINAYSPVAIREAVINALLHADYAMKGSSIQIAIFNDRIEITNPGALPFGQTLESAMAGVSRLRNRVVGRIFRKLKLIEKLGSGLQRIISSCQQMGAKIPRFEEVNNHFRVTLFPMSERFQTSEFWQEQLISVLSEKQSLRTKEIADIWKVTTRTARTRLRTLQSVGLIKRIATTMKDPNAIYILARSRTRRD